MFCSYKNWVFQVKRSYLKCRVCSIFRDTIWEFAYLMSLHVLEWLRPLLNSFRNAWCLSIGVNETIFSSEKYIKYMKIRFSSEIRDIKLFKKYRITKVLCILWGLNTVTILVTCALLIVLCTRATQCT